MVLHAARGGGGGPAGPATQRACEGMEAPLSVSHDDISRDALSPVRLELRCRPTLVFSAVGGPSGEGVERTRGAAVEATEEVVDAQIALDRFFRKIFRKIHMPGQSGFPEISLENTARRRESELEYKYKVWIVHIR